MTPKTLVMFTRRQRKPAHIVQGTIHKNSPLTLSFDIYLLYSFGEEKFRGTRTVAVSTSPYDPNEPGPYVTFTFRYRSRGTFSSFRIQQDRGFSLTSITELLKANGIISSQRDNPRKRPSEDEEVIEIESDEEVGFLTILEKTFWLNLRLD